MPEKNNLEGISMLSVLQQLSTRKVRRFVFYAYVFFILFMALFPFSTVGVTRLDEVYVVNYRLDHLVHLLAFFPAYAIFFSAFVPTNMVMRILVFLSALVFAALAEHLQIFVSYRFYNPADLYSNMAGVVIGWIGFQIFAAVFPEIFRKYFC